MFMKLCPAEMRVIDVSWASERDEEAISPTTTPRPGGRRHTRHARPPARAEQPDRQTRPGRRRRRRVRPAVLATLIAVIFAVPGGVYLGFHDTAHGSAGHGTTRRLTQPGVRGSATAAIPGSPHPAGQAGDYAIAQTHYTFTEHSAATGPH